MARAGAGAGAGAEIKDKGVAGAENKSFRLRNTEKMYFLQNKAQIFFFIYSLPGPSDLLL